MPLIHGKNLSLGFMLTIYLMQTMDTFGLRILVLSNIFQHPGQMLGECYVTSSRSIFIQSESYLTDWIDYGNPQSAFLGKEVRNNGNRDY